MADLEQSLYEALQKEAAGNIYNDLAGVTNSVGSSALQLAVADAARPKSERQYGLGESLGVSVGTGLLGGLLDGLGQNQAAADSQSLYSVLSGKTSDQGDLSNSLYKKALTYKDLIQAQRVRDQQEKLADAMLDIRKADAIGTNSDVRQLGIAGLLEREKLLGQEKTLADLSGGGLQGNTSQIDPAEVGPIASGAGYSAMLDDAANGGASARPPILTKMGKEIRSIEDSAREKVSSSGVGTKFGDIKTNFESMLDFYQFNDKPATTAMISSFARVLDPGSTVRGEEIKNAQNAQSFFQQLGYDMKSLMDGTQQLGPEAKAAMVRAAGAKYNRFGGDYMALLNKQKNRVKGVGGSEDAVFGEVEYKPFKFVDWYKTNKDNIYTIDEQMNGKTTPKTGAAVPLPNLTVNGAPATFADIQAEIAKRRAG